MFKFNTELVKKIIYDAGTKQFQGIAYGAALQSFNAAKNEMIEEFLEDPITKEIQAGPEADPDSGVLNASGGENNRGGNLFSYIGFYEGEDPITEVVNVLEEGTQMDKKPEILQRGSRIRFNFRVRLPTKSALEKVTKMHWASRSWLFGIETGISGVNRYLFFYYPPDVSRSTTAIQDKRQLNRVTFTPKQYISRILTNFAKKF